MENRVFRFTDYNVPIDIEGQNFVLNCSSETGDYLKSMSNEMQELSSNYKNGIMTKAELLLFCQKKINYLLGDGAFEQIFKNRKATISDIADLLIFLAQTISDFRKERN